MSSTAQIIPISPLRKDVSQLLTASNDLMNSLYPAESNHLDNVEELSKSHVLLLGILLSDELIGIGAVKKFRGEHAYGEIKRVYIKPEYRGRKFSIELINALESHLKEQQIFIACLETGISQPEALGLYRKLGYSRCEAFGNYTNDPYSVFMRKEL